MSPKKPRTEKRKSYQQFVWQQAGIRHAQRREAQNGRAAANIQLRREGKPTPWEAACQLRLARRAAIRAALPAGGQS